MRKKAYALLACLLGLMVVVSACSGNGNGNGNSNNNASPGASASANGSAPTSSPEAGTAASPEAAPSASAGENAQFPRTIKAANGDVAIEKAPQKVAVVHWGYGDSLLLFDLPSVGIALPFSEQQSVLHNDSYKPYVDKVKELKVIGENTTVNMESLVAYAPDLIIAGNAVNKDIVPELEKIAPTVVIDETTTDVWSNWPALVTKFGEILGQEQTAADYIEGYRAKLQSGKEKLAGLKGSVAFLQVRDNAVWLQGTNFLKPYYEGMGLTPPTSKDMAEGAQLTLEGLSALNPDYLFLGYFNFDDKSVPAATDEWEKNGVWKNLKAVKDGRVYGINGQLALGYGPIGNAYGVQAVIDALGQ